MIVAVKRDKGRATWLAGPLVPGGGGPLAGPLAPGGGGPVEGVAVPPAPRHLAHGDQPMEHTGWSLTPPPLNLA